MKKLNKIKSAKEMLLIALFLLANLIDVSAQIITNNKKPEPETVKVAKKEKYDVLSYAFVGAGIGKSSRTLEPNEAFLNTPLGERANEFDINRWSYHLGLNFPLYKYIRLDGGISLLQNGEQYEFQSTIDDSSFLYQNRYRYIGMPIQLQLHYGSTWSVFGGIGLAPQIFSAYRQEQQWTNATGSQFKKKIDETNACDYFVLSMISSIGIKYFPGGNVGVRANFSYRRQLTNTYTKYQNYIHKAAVVGCDFGLIIKL